ncbi:hypothetical protein EHI8A_089020 [Entamoeba histolytica HM-1:IMSS-B]|uniref:G patch domain-containing protein n=6 Tax=Entamoeba histolytica TaxID=5759 RepID=C4MBT5_ENTH1|nr:hypothetical protein EHI_179500 [Entamoeba histolytica HM-1:IMSS]EMD48506.1 Hypothetical protein EHI5A_102880 [Entamoeba histolytica KU27]EMH78203.1 hypothetical protein EHI8A_089020 [Entamoeba histolytica HM-1:IMSS-B]EMS17535.1 hypothetical protein KM1_119800 [Entamoeba histolytica HM-3:IMSS]ENY63340.1 hypothetical protein EHI7A_086700 [Entamoeba histolytica HM-1:IMSS-A]GAT99688.1 hypothetical protein CL6EHI_179500 [Entamoeba histolytica]|eukprot:XP_649952.1 hypothetical protein EHI_179500 [Entamoeba histolytica HM-1:IMSS]
MKRKTKDIQYKINKNALKETRLQYAYDSNGKKMFHGAFEGGNVKEIDKIETEQFEPMGFTYFQGGKGKKIELGIEDIVDDEDGIDFKQKEKEIEKLIKSGMSFVEAQKFLKDIQWDGKESIIVKRKGKDYEVTFGREDEQDKIIETENSQLLINEVLGKGSDEIKRNEEEIKKRLKDISIKREFEDGKKQKRYELYLEEIANKNADLSRFTDQERKEFSGTAIGRLCIGKDDQSHLNWLNKFISSTQLQNKQQEEKIEKKDNKIERIIQSIEVPILVKERFNI